MCHALNYVRVQLDYLNLSNPQQTVQETGRIEKKTARSHSPTFQNEVKGASTWPVR